MGADAAAFAASEVWRHVVDAMADAALVLDANGTVVHANALVREMFAMAGTGQPISLVSRHPDFLAALDRVQATGERSSVGLRERVPVERQLSATIAALPVASPAPGVPRLLVTFRDLTEQEKLEQMRVDFIANASHELRTPLASLRGYVETLQGAASNDAAARERFLGIMWSQTIRMTRLVDDLLSLSRIEMRTHIAPSGVVDLNSVATFVCQTLEPIARGQNVKLTLVGASGPANVRGEREEIVQLVQNLVQNAIKYGRDGGSAAVSIVRSSERGRLGSRLSVIVRDDGPGIPSQHLPRLTERFYRVSVSTSREKGGTGLGLAIVKHIALRHRADLRIHSEVGVGSTFTVVFDEIEGRE
ncbi:MAG: ATP-binding protein [Hyphomicrobiaceae bacterium]|nr:ATP-binding protein [Hyphomicrobiaceae bacterium]